MHAAELSFRGFQWQIVAFLFSDEQVCSKLMMTHEVKVIKLITSLLFIQFSHSVVSNSLWLHEPQHTRPPCPSPTPGGHPNPCPLCWWCHPTISSSVVPFSSHPQSSPASGSFPMSQLFASGGQISFSFSISPSNEHPGLICFRMDQLDLLAVQGTLKSLLQHHSSKHQFFDSQFSF